MGKNNKARFFLLIIESNSMMVPVIIDSTVNINDRNTAMSLWGGDGASGSLVEICCSMVKYFFTCIINV